MSLAANLDNEIIKSVNVNFTEIVNLSKYRDCKKFVSFVNDISFYTSTLIMLEVDNKTREYFFQEGNFNAFYEINRSLIEDVKNYPDKKLKKKYLRIEKSELDAFEFLKIRYNQLLRKEYPLKLVFPEAENSETQSKYSHIQLKDIAAFLLGAIYDSIAEEDADFLSPFVKAKIKNAYTIAGDKMSYMINIGSFEKNTAKILTSHKRTFDELAK